MTKVTMPEHLEKEIERLRAELHEARQALRAVQAAPDVLRAEVVALEKSISERFGACRCHPKSFVFTSARR